MGESMRSRGMRDILPEEMGRIRRIESTFREVCLGWGYDEIRTPTIEHLYLFTAGGALSPQMLDRVYSFLDWDGWSGERVVLRPDSTIPAVRLFEEAMSGREGAKLFYVQPVFRFEPGDTSREDYQCGVELLGDTFPHGDIELILMASEVLQQLGIAAELRLSHPGIVRGLLGGGDAQDISAIYDALLDGDAEPLREALVGLPNASAVFGVLSVEGEGPRYLQNLRAVLQRGSPSEAALEELASVSGVITGLGLTHKINPLGVRNFEYYTGPVFTLLHGDDRIGGGGRYDSLAGLIGGRAVPASGFALEVDRLAQMIVESGEALETITVRGETTADLGAAFELARRLRLSIAGARVTVGTRPGSPEVVVSDAGFSLSWNGSSAQRFDSVDATVEAVARSLATES